MGQHSFQGLGGVGLPSSGGVMAKVPCEFTSESAKVPRGK